MAVRMFAPQLIVVTIGGKPFQRGGMDQLVDLDQPDRQPPETLAVVRIRVVKKHRQAPDDGVASLHQFKRPGQRQFLRFDSLTHLG